MSNRQAYLALPILNIFVPQVGQTPWVAGLPFFIVISFVSFISRLALHLTQYAFIVLPPPDYLNDGSNGLTANLIRRAGPHHLATINLTIRIGPAILKFILKT
jgi:hypothetical protein